MVTHRRKHFFSEEKKQKTSESSALTDSPAKSRILPLAQE
jgi:hypothetical protein